MKKLLTLLILFTGLNPLFSQFNFTNSNGLLENTNVHSGVAVGVADMNNDGLDDIVRLDQGYILMFDYQGAPGAQLENYVFGPLGNQSEWSICVADVDNNGFNDVIAGGSYNEVKLVKADATGSMHTMEYLPNGSLFVQGSNFADINNDGFVDYFACHDDAESKIWINDGTGNLVSADETIDMATTPVSDNSGNYGSVWTDFDNDGDTDLYIAKCRQGVGSSSDPRRINALFVNDGNGNYTEQAEDYGIKIGAQTWTADFGDIDNDGDMDLYMTNHDLTAMLYLNDGTGHFTDVTAGSGIDESGFFIQGVFSDFDNDGFVDIISTASGARFYHNDGDGTFTKLDTELNNNTLHSYALGDLNGDGFVDIYGSYGTVYTNPSSIDDVLWLNEGNDNNYLAIRPIGTVSNSKGIGARVEIHGEWGVQIREIRSGESYGIMNSLNAYFGIGQAETIDQVVIKWPSGIVDTYENVSPNQMITVVEDNCISPDASVALDGNTVLCPGETLTITAPDGFEYNWSNDMTTQSITVAESGIYSVTIDDGTGCQGVSQLVEVVVNPDATPTIELIGETTFCEGGTVQLVASEADSYLWSNGDITQSTEIAESGTFTVEVPGLCQDFESAPYELTLTAITSENPTADDVIIPAPGTATLTAAGNGEIYWYDDFDATEPVGVGATYETPMLDDNATYFAQNAEILGGLDANVGIEAHTTNSQFSSSNFNGEIIFDAYDAFTLKTVKVYTDLEGVRRIELREESGAILQTVDIMIPEGEHIIDLNFEVPVGTNLALAANTDWNLATFGFESARLRRSNQGVEYPYVVEDVVSLNTSQFGMNHYYYFYDWTIEQEGEACLSEKIPVEVTLKTVSVQETEYGQLSVYPNPTSGQVVFEIPAILANNATLQILDLNGRVVQSRTALTEKETMNLSSLAKGIYLAKLTSNNETYTSRIILQ